MRLAASFHEAGHAACAMVLGYTVSAVELHQRGGRTLYATARDERDEAVIAFAGTIAQHRAVPGSPLTVSDDFAVINQCADQRGCRAQAQALVEANWGLVERVARELLEHGRLQVCDAVADRIGAVLTK
jgi:hypothetical protein